MGPTGTYLNNPGLARLNLQGGGALGRLRMYSARNALNKAVRNGEISAKDASREANMLSMIAEDNRANNAASEGPSVMRGLGQVIAPWLNTARERWSQEREYEMTRPARIHNMIDRGSQASLMGTAPFLSMIMQNSSPLTAGPMGMGFNSSNFMQQPMGMMGGMMGGMQPVMSPQLMGGMNAMPSDPLGLGSMNNLGFNPNMMSFPPMMQGSFPNMNQMDHRSMHPQMMNQNPLLNAPQNHFMPTMQGQNGQIENITLSGLGTFKGPKDKIDKLNDLKEKYGDADTISKRQHIINSATTLLTHSAPNFLNQQNRNSLRSLMADDFRNIATDFLTDGMSKGQIDKNLEALSRVGIESPKDIEGFENIITADSLNTYKQILSNLNPNARSIGAALRTEMQVHGTVTEETKNILRANLSSNDDQKGLHANQFELLDKAFENCPPDIDNNTLAKILSDSVNGAASHINNSNGKTKQSDDDVVMVRNINNTGAVSGSIKPTSIYPSYIDTIIGGRDDTKSVTLDMRNVSYDEGRWTGRIKFKDTRGNSHHIDLDTISNNGEDFNNAFESLYNGFLEARKNGLQTFSGGNKIKLGLLEKYILANRPHDIGAEAYDEDQTRKGDEDLTPQ